MTDLERRLEAERTTRPRVGHKVMNDITGRLITITKVIRRPIGTIGGSWIQYFDPVRNSTRCLTFEDFHKASKADLAAAASLCPAAPPKVEDPVPTCFADLDEFTSQYIRTALWSSIDTREPDSDYGRALEDVCALDDLDPGALQTIAKECAAFQAANAADIGLKSQSAGHDFWLTRNEHGAGFHDGDWPEEAADRLADASDAAGEQVLYRGDDGKVYIG